VSPERLRDDIENQNRYRQDATPILASRVRIKEAKPSQTSQSNNARVSGSIGSYQSAGLEDQPDSNRVTYLDLKGVPLEVRCLNLCSFFSAEN
jgi:hypothetical protein